MSLNVIEHLSSATAPTSSSPTSRSGACRRFHGASRHRQQGKGTHLIRAVDAHPRCQAGLHLARIPTLRSSQQVSLQAAACLPQLAHGPPLAAANCLVLSCKRRTAQLRRRVGTQGGRCSRRDPNLCGLHPMEEWAPPPRGLGTRAHDAGGHLGPPSALHCTPPEEAENVRGVASQAWDVGAARCACKAPTRIRSGGSSSWQWWRCVHVPVRGLLLSITVPPPQRRQHPDQPQQQAEAAAAALALAELRSIWAGVATHGTRTTAATSAQQWPEGTHGAILAGTLWVRAGGSGFVLPTSPSLDVCCGRGRTS
jgi:hypothetical protein